jgi:hypothetical protein
MSRRKAKSKPSPVPAKAGLEPQFLPPPRPRRGLFAALMGAMVLWVVFLLVLYFTTVYPQRAKERWQKGQPADGRGVSSVAARRDHC